MDITQQVRWYRKARSDERHDTTITGFGRARDAQCDDERAVPFVYTVDMLGSHTAITLYEAIDVGRAPTAYGKGRAICGSYATDTPELEANFSWLRAKGFVVDEDRARELMTGDAIDADDAACSALVSPPDEADDAWPGTSKWERWAAARRVLGAPVRALDEEHNDA